MIPKVLALLKKTIQTKSTLCMFLD
ncbi:UNVERIFIED_CONTAM: hypothetical protein GTU68_038923 [Idotea baltica]|nr:hypothetical protein [Idotea baltica]